ncbi:uncharacterized protein EI97DRAFT_461871 [Westerdykella ornata]|uniref:DUF7730 domain-containing protein n=1 Tax=Westerdykella ornata TaxID=318751 RepID=A0A6A6J7R3_WESOR|nr:uncharacterized protein EI97DRAFT_461871 [Westerdykella ornata]KAF2272620.1 hypothetical protein EI97DRAFT_461871 [Westerdykella ornata]
MLNLLSKLIDRGIARKVNRKRLARQQREDNVREEWAEALVSLETKRAGMQWIADNQRSPNNQDASALFRLSPELRIAIYGYLYAGLDVFIYEITPYHLTDLVIRTDRRLRLFSFSETCLLAYHESQEYIYKHAVFCVEHAFCVRLLPFFVAPTWLHTIRHLRLQFLVEGLYSQAWPSLLPPHDEATWEEAWDIVSNMKGLQLLVVKLRLRGRFIAEHAEQKLSESLKKVRGVDYYKLSLDWIPSSEAFSESDSTPWHLVKVPEFPDTSTAGFRCSDLL